MIQPLIKIFLTSHNNKKKKLIIVTIFIFIFLYKKIQVNGIINISIKDILFKKIKTDNINSLFKSISINFSFKISDIKKKNIKCPGASFP